MKIIQTIPEQNTYSSNILRELKESDLFFDIESTGLSKTYHTIYLIGCMFLEHNELVIRQYFCEDTSEEKSVLEEFTKFANHFDSFISFNGERFDIPFLEEKIKHYGLFSPFKEKSSLDLYKISKKYQHVLKINNLKQKTIEATLGCSRTDLYSGGELIQIYFEFVKTRNDTLFHDLMLHNYDDMLGMSYLVSLLSLESLDTASADTNAEIIQNIDYDGNNRLQLIIKGTLPLSITTTLSYSYNDYYLLLSPNGYQICVTTHDNKIKVPYSNYKNYVYLISEDMAIPKTLSAGVSKANVKKCTPENCYGWQTISDNFISNKQILKSYSEKVLNYLFNTNNKTPKK